MTLDQGFHYLEGFTNLERKPDPTTRAYRLDRMKRMLEVFGHPESAFRSIHVAGSKGKGSTCAYLAGGLKALSLRTGLYTSPHLLSYTERITQAGSPFPDGLYVSNLERIRTWVEEGGGDLLVREYGQGPTTFELLTLLAFLVFRDAGMEWVVVETGLGGRLDATNVILPEACVLTPIELEHTDILGNTLEAIAGEKAGIIKSRTPVFCAPQPRQAYEVFRQRARELECGFTYLPQAVTEVEVHPHGLGTRVRWTSALRGTQGQADLSMAGQVMAWNALLALEVLETLFTPGPSGGRDLLQGLEGVRMPARAEYLAGTPPVLLDGAHTRRSCEELVRTLGQFFPGERTLIFGAVEGKDWEGMAEVLSPAFRHIIITTPGEFKKSSPPDLFKVFQHQHARALLEPDLRKAWEHARNLGHPVVVCGSFYLAADFLRIRKT